jgi:hypothetical protein
VSLPRIQAFELNDSAWAPAPLRDLIVESLGRTLRWSRVIEGVVEPFARFVEEAGADEVLDLGSGSGEPAAILAGALRARGMRVPRFVLTDLFPRPEVWAALRERDPAIDFVSESVDATRIPEELSRGRARTVINVLHHLPPDLAAGVVGDAVRSGAPAFIVEGFERNPLGFLPFAPLGLPALALGPLLAKRDRVAKAALAWLTPVALAASVWDGLVSTMRIHTERDLRAMVAAAGGDPTRCSAGTYAFPFGGKGTFFSTIVGRREPAMDR